MGITKSLKRALTNAGFGFFTESRGFDDDHELMLAVLHPDADEEGGLACNDAKLLEEMRECIMQFIKSMGRQLLQGNLNLVNTSFPVLMFEPRSYLHKLGDMAAYPEYMNRAAACKADPLERLKLVVTWLIAGMQHCVECWKKPFNPILGETWQASMPCGCHIYMEQISHHPPVSAYQLEGPGWQLNGWSQPAVVPVVKFYGIKTMAKGSRSLHFDADDAQIDMTMPAFAIKGVVYAAKPRAEVLGVARLLDTKNRLEAVISFGPVPGTRQRRLARADAVCGEIYQLPKAAHLHVSSAGGAIQRSSTSAVPVNDLCSDTDQQLSLASSTSDESSAVNEPTTADAPDDVDEAIYRDFHATHFGEASSTAASTSQQATNSSAGVSKAASAPAAAPAAASAPAAVPLPDHYHRSRSMGQLRAHGLRTRQEAEVPGVAVARIEGSWLSHLNIDNKRYWTRSESQRTFWQAQDASLPSDAQYRQDLSSLAEGDLGAAQHWKEVLEQQQRADRKLRESVGVFEH